MRRAINLAIDREAICKRVLRGLYVARLQSGAAQRWRTIPAASSWILPIHEVDMAVPISPAELACKQRAIFQHESQKHQAPFLGENGSESTDGPHDSARAMSRLFDALGLPDYEAIETFHRWVLG